MTQMSQSGATTYRHARWVAMWRYAVRSSRLTMGLVELSTSRFIELSHKAAELLGTTPEEGFGLNYLSVAERPQDAADTFRLVREGMLDGIRAHQRYRRLDGSMVEVESSGWAIRFGPGLDLGLWAASEVLSETDRTASPEEAVTASYLPNTGSNLVMAVVTLDDRWQIARIRTDASLLLGRTLAELGAKSMIELTHPDDLAALLFAFARATTESGVSVRFRLSHKDGSWRTTRVAPTVLQGDGTLPFSVVLTVEEEPEPPDSSGEVGRLAGHLRRIAAQIEAAGMLDETADFLTVAVMSDLSARQRQVVSRLVRGERVATIAAEMYLSRSTVRNHLSAIFRKVGVHSQQEFLALWRPDSRVLSPVSERDP